MRLSDFAALNALNTEQRAASDFYRCYNCGWLFTRDHELRSFREMTATGSMDKGICPCRSVKYTPSFPRFYEWLKPSVVAYTVKLVLARAVAPWCDAHWPAALPWIEGVVRIKE